MSDLPEQLRSSVTPALWVHNLFVNVEGLRIRVPKPLFGFVPFTVNKHFGFYVVMNIAAPRSSESGLLLGLAKTTLADEFAITSRSPPSEWRIQQINCREVGAAPTTFQQPGCIDQDWGALWYELGNESMKRERYALAKQRLWEEGFRVPIDTST